MRLLKEIDEKSPAKMGDDLHGFRGRALPDLPKYYRERPAADAGHDQEPDSAGNV